LLLLLLLLTLLLLSLLILLLLLLLQLLLLGLAHSRLMRQDMEGHRRVSGPHRCLLQLLLV
jgi:hypothetical protein